VHDRIFAVWQQVCGQLIRISATSQQSDDHRDEAGAHETHSAEQ
jgi:hypothetical protein